MKKLFKAYAEYNMNTNRIIFDTASAMDKNFLIKEFDTYYPSLGENLFHVIESDTRWVNRMAPLCEPQVSIETVQDLKEKITGNRNTIIEKWAEIVEIRKNADDNITGIINSIRDEDLNKNFEIQFGPEKITMILWKLLLQWFNHHTHHRGQISVIFDMLGIDNDYSSVLDKINHGNQNGEVS